MIHFLNTHDFPAIGNIATIPMIINCPQCCARHIDEGEFADLSGARRNSTRMAFNSYRDIRTMTEQEARTEAEKRERHKSKHMTHKRWSAVHNSVKGWHVALIDVPPVTADTEITSESVVFMIATTLFGPHAVAQALAALARRDERQLGKFPRGGTVKPNSIAFDSPRTMSGPEFIIPHPHKREKI